MTEFVPLTAFGTCPLIDSDLSAPLLCRSVGDLLEFVDKTDMTGLCELN